MLVLKGYLQSDSCRTLSEENREYRPKQRMNVGRMERIGWLERGSGKMSKRPKPFEYKGKKKTRHPRESLWRDGLSFSKWWRCRESNPGPEQCLIQSPHSSPVLMVSWSGTAPVKAVPLARMNTRLPLRAKADGAYLREPKLKRELCHPAVFE